MTTVTVLTYDQVMEKLPAIVADCLAIDLEEVTPDMVFCGDGDSINYLDLNFRCEKAFNIKSPFRLFIGSRDQLTLDEDGYLTEAARQTIRKAYPFFAEKIDHLSKLQPKDMLIYVTIAMIGQFVLHAAETQSTSSQAA